MTRNGRAAVAFGGSPDRVVGSLAQDTAAVRSQMCFEIASLHGAATIRRCSRGEIDRDRLCVPAADRRLTALVVVGSDHLARRVEQHRPRLLDRPPTRDDGRPFGELRHRPAILVGREHRGEGQRIAHTSSMAKLTSAGQRLEQRPRAPTA
jgi:hypothetical protein